MWKCIGVSDTSYTWKKLVSEDSGENAALTGAERSTLIAVVNAIGVFNAINGQELVDSFNAAWGAGGGGTEPDDPDAPGVMLTSISTVYSGGDVTVGTAVVNLTGIVVTAHYSDGSTAAVTDYSLSGEITEGSNTITVTYQGKTTSFAVTGIAESAGENNGWVNGVAYDIEWTDGYMPNNTTGELDENSAWSVSQLLPCAGASAVLSDRFLTGRSGFYWAYDGDGNYLGRTLFVGDYPNAIPSQVKYLKVIKAVGDTDGVSPVPVKYPELTEHTVWESGEYYEIGHKLGSLSNTGAEIESSSQSVSNYCMCYGAKKLMIYPQNTSYSRRFVAFYDADKNFISDVGGGSWTTAIECAIPDNTMYFRVACMSGVQYSIVNPDKPIVTLE